MITEASPTDLNVSFTVLITEVILHQSAYRLATVLITEASLTDPNTSLYSWGKHHSEI